MSSQTDDYLTQLQGSSAYSPATALNGGGATAALNGAPADLTARMNAAKSQYQTDLASEDKAMQPAIQKFQQQSAQPIPAPPEPKKAAAAPDAQQFNKDAQGWVVALSALSALVGARGRGRGTAALNAFAAGMKGIQDGKQQAFKDAYETWKGETEQMDKENAQEMDKYKAVLSNRELSTQEAFDQIKMIGYEHQNKLMMDAKDYDQATAMVDSYQKAKFSVDLANAKLDAKANEALRQQKEKDDRQDAVLEHFSTLKPTDIVPGYGITKAAVMDKVNGLKSGLNYPDVGISMRGTNNPLKDLVDSIKASTDAGGSRAEEKLGYMEQQTEAKAIAARSAPAKIAVKEMDRLAQPMVDAIKKLDPSQYPDLNSLKNAVEKKAGGADVVKANLAVQEFKNAFTNLMIRNGVPTDAARGKADAIMDTNFNLSQIEGVRDQAKISGAAVLDALADAKGGITGKTAESTPTGGIPADAPTATGKNGEKMYWNGTAWVK